jgi:surfactin synthase thioesterase subunit
VSGQSWLVPFGPLDGRPVLLCLPQAGSGCGVFRSWQAVCGAGATVVGVQLPGRENRFTDPPPVSFGHAVAEITAALAAGDIAPAVLFGHSLGGLFGYEVARALPAPPSALVVAASLPPHRCGAVAGSIVHDTDEGFAQALADKGVDEDMRELAVAVLRQDAGLAATYRDPGRTPVPCDLHVWGADEDDRVPADALDEWRGYAGRAFARRRFTGGHDFCLAPGVAADVCALLAVGQEV